MTKRLPAEWEEQDGVFLAWPHENSDWAPYLDAVKPVFAELATHISRFESVLITAPEPERAREILTNSGCEMKKVSLFKVDSNDTWARDFGPITVMEDNKPLLLDFVFNGWGLKFAADKDNLISRRLAGYGAFKSPLRHAGLVLEGGSIESDGNGTIMTTSRCLMCPNRNHHLSREDIEKELERLLGADRLLWLESGHLEGDDTDSHVDTLARFCPDETILHVACDDPSDNHFSDISAMVAELGRFRTRDGRPYRLVPLPWPKPILDDEGNRLPATYANFLVINGAVLVPTYGDPGDNQAMAVIGNAFPGREIIGIECRPLIQQHGSLHCVTMQLPKGTISTGI